MSSTTLLLMSTSVSVGRCCSSLCRLLNRRCSTARLLCHRTLTLELGLVGRLNAIECELFCLHFTTIMSFYVTFQRSRTTSHRNSALSCSVWSRCSWVSSHLCELVVMLVVWHLCQSKTNLVDRGCSRYVNVDIRVVKLAATTQAMDRQLGIGLAMMHSAPIMDAYRYHHEVSSILPASSVCYNYVISKLWFRIVQRFAGWPVTCGLH